MGTKLYFGLAQPVFRPSPDVSDIECRLEFIEFELSYDKYAENCKNVPHLFSAFYIASYVLSLAGIVLIYWANRKITGKTISFSSQRTNYILHLSMLSLFVAAEVFSNVGQTYL